DGAGRGSELCAGDEKMKKALATTVSTNATTSKDIDAQLRDPQMGKRFGLQSSKGFGDGEHSSSNGGRYWVRQFDDSGMKGFDSDEG
ncbi:hypothetical protein U1Q18_014255, partial [Sarracenia purpurea var. burkii]